MSSAGAAAAVAAAQQARRMQAEEEAMAQYTAEELAGGWEFKFLRSARGEFKKPEKLRQYLDEEALAGWQLIEKFDSSRLRLKRPVSARTKDASLSFDPYRTSVGPSELSVALLIAGGALGLVAAIIAVIAAVTHRGP